MRTWLCLAALVALTLVCVPSSINPVEARFRAVRDAQKEEAPPPDDNAESGASAELDEVEPEEDEDEDDGQDDDETGVEKRALGFRVHRRCIGPMVVGGCRRPRNIVRYWYDAESNTCKQFIYKGCQGTPNNWIFLRNCLRKCIRPPTPAPRPPPPPTARPTPKPTTKPTTTVTLRKACKYPSQKLTPDEKWCYSVHLEQNSYDVSKQNCKNEGGYLATYKTQADLDFLKSVSIAKNPGAQFWIGLERTGPATDAPVQWADGSTHAPVGVYGASYGEQCYRICKDGLVRDVDCKTGGPFDAICLASPIMIP